jgi:TolB-like protein
LKHAAFLIVLVAFCNGRLARGEDRPSDAVKTIAVLDFVNRNPAGGRNWLGKGLADMVITDLSASHRMTVVDRERVQDLAREMELTAAGVVDPGTASRVGQIAKVRRVLFGTFLCRGNAVAIEALIIDVTTRQSVRIEHVEGPLNSLFDLEQRLVRSILAKLDVPMTDEELRMVKLLKTQSLPAFEHYARSLGLVDEGRCFDGLREARLARRADPAYFAAAARLAQLYYDVGEPEHAMLEYRRFVDEDRRDKLPAEVYLTMGKILEQALADRAGAIGVLQRIVGRDPQYEHPFRITDPPPPSRSFDELGGMSRVNALFEEHKSALQALERVARWQLEAGEEHDAAQRYGRLWRFLDTHGMSVVTGHLVAFSGLQTKVRNKYEPLYWQMVRENRDAALYPVAGVHVLSADGEAVGPETKPTHGFFWYPIWLAPPDQEIAEARFSLEDDGTKIPDQMKGKAQIDFRCKGNPSFETLPSQVPAKSGESLIQTPTFKAMQVKPDGTWHTVKFEPGTRAIETVVFAANRWQIKFVLRPFSPPTRALPKVGSLTVLGQPPSANLYIYVNGRRYGPGRGVGIPNLQPGRHEVEARWPDGRRRSAVVEVVPGQTAVVELNCEAHMQTLSRRVIAPDGGSNSQLFTDRNGRIWLVWDNVSQGNLMHLDVESNLYYATSTDGASWSRPRRLPMSLLNCDATPLLQQDRRGVFWLLWVSNRDPNAPKTPWIASSPNGIEWSFPRKLVLPDAKKPESATWPINTIMPRPGFAIDARNVFWLIWQGCLMRSEDAVHWQVDPLWETRDDRTPGDVWECHLVAAADGLLLVANHLVANNPISSLWRLEGERRWRTLGSLNEPPGASEYAGNAASLSDGTVLTVSGDECLREFATDGSKSKPLGFKPVNIMPFHPSVAPLPGGRILVAFGSKDGLVATVLRKVEADDTQDGKSISPTKGQK